MKRKNIAIIAGILAVSAIISAFPVIAASDKSSESFVSVFSKNSAPGTPIIFTYEDFSERTVGKDTLTAIKINTLPSSGTLKLAGNEIKASQQIPADMLSALTFFSKSDENVHTSFTFYPVFKKAGLSARLSTVSVNISAREDHAPVAIDLSFETYPDINVCGEFQAKDAENGECSFIIINCPKKGTVEMTEKGFCYVPSGKAGKDSFTYIAIDPCGNPSEPATVEIIIKKRSSGCDTFYNDLENTDCHYAAVKLSEMGILKGETVGQVSLLHPEAEVSRGEFLAMVAVLCDLPSPAAAVSTGLSDNDAMPEWLRPYVVSAISCGLVSGTSDGQGGREFRAQDAVTRAEAAVILNRVLGIPDEEHIPTFADTVPAWAAQAAGNTYYSGVISALSDGTFGAGIKVTRADCVKMLYSAARLKGMDQKSIMDIFK